MVNVIMGATIIRTAMASMFVLTYMAVCFPLKEIVVFLCIVEILFADRDLLESIQLDTSNPPELNDFLENVMQHKQVFSWIRHAAREAAHPPSEEMERYRNDMRSTRYNKPQNVYNKRNTRNRRPINDLHPYLYENDDLVQDGTMRNTLRKRRRQRGFYRSRRSKGSVSFSPVNDHEDGEVKIAPRSEAGVLNVPGQKYAGRRGAKRDCDDEYETHERVTARANKSNATGRDTGSEYYFTTPHDVLGLDQDIQKESDNLNATCIAVKRDAVRRENAPSTRSATNKVTSASTAMPIVKTSARQTINQNQPEQIYQQQMPSLQQTQMLRQPNQVIQQRASAPISPPTGSEQIQPQQQLQIAPNQAIKTNPNNAVVNDQKAQDFAKLIRFVDSPSKEQQMLSKQELLKKDNDDILENIDRVLKSDRTGLNLFHNVGSFNGASIKRDENKDANNQNHNEAAKVKRQSAEHDSDKGSRSVDKNDKKQRMEVDITLNAQPVSEFVGEDKKISHPRRISNLHKKKTHPSKFSLNLDPDNKDEPFSKTDQQTSDEQQQMLADPNLKIMENADDENNDNLKQTLKEYINRQNEYNMGKQPEQEQEEDNLTPNYNLLQEKKNMLEDQTEPTSAAEQRELGRIDNYVTPSLLNDSDTDNTLIVIPLKKSVQNDRAATSRNGEFDYIKDGFKVKEAQDVIHVRTHHGTKGPVFKKDVDPQGFDNTIFTKTVFNKIKDDLEESSRLELGESSNLKQLSTKEKHTAGDYSSNSADYSDHVQDKEDKVDLSKPSNAVYGEYENFDLKKRDIPSSPDGFKSRKLNWIENNDPYRAKVRRKRQLNFDAEDTIDKRSEEDEPDEEPGNDSKEPVEHEKKVQKAPKSNEFSPKKEEGEMTLHMDTGGDIKRNDTNNDYPPDDENEPPKGLDGNKTAPQVITYNYFNISVNLVSTTTSSPDSGTSCAAEIDTPVEESTSSSDQPLLESGSETRSTQISKLEDNVIKYTDKFKQTIDESLAKENEKLDEKKKDVKIQPKEIEEDDSDEHPYSKNQVDLNAVKQILHEDDDNVGDKNVERSVDKDTESALKKAEHSIRNAVDEAKHREMLISKLERLVNSYKTQVQHIVDPDGENIDKRSNEQENEVHHHPHEKKVPQLPRPDCIDAPMVKHVLHNPNARYIKPQEIYYEPESMADDLKEKLLFNKIYNRVVRKRKKAPDPFMYKLIDSVFGNEEEEEQMCPVDLNGNVPAKRTDKNQDTIQRQKKKTEKEDEIVEEGLKKTSHDSVKKKQIGEESKAVLDDVDSFKDVIEMPTRKALRKRELNKRNLEDFPNSYLSPVNEGFGGEVKQRLRRRLKYLHKPQKKKVRQISYEDYVQMHGMGPKRLASNSDNKQSGQAGNFNKAQNFNVKNQNKIKAPNDSTTANDAQALKEGGVSTRIVTASTPRGLEYKITEKNCTEFEDLKSNHSKMVECEERKKEHEDMRKMLNGFLPLKIIDIFNDRLKENPELYSRFSGSISNSKQCASENAHNVKLFREEQAKIDIKHAEGMLHEVIIMLNQIVADQVHRRTCLQLAPNLKIFVIRITKNLRNMKKNYQVAEGYPLPKIKSRSGEEVPVMPPEEDQGDFLFGGTGDSPSVGEETDAKTDINKKIKLIEKLLEKYQSMSTRCQVQVEPVKDYLLKHLGLLMKLLEKAQDSSTCATTTKNQEPMVREQELEPPHNNVSIKTVALPPPPKIQAASTTANTPSADRVKKLQGEQDSEVSQRQLVMLRKQQQEEEKQQQLLQRQIQEQEMMQRMQEQMQQEQLQQQPSQIQETVQQQLRPVSRRSEQNNQIINNDNNKDAQTKGQLQEQALPPALVDQRSADKPETKQQQTPPKNQGNTSAAVAALVQKELDPQGLKYTNPETVTKDLLNLGLDIANTFIPPYDLNRMVQENVIKSNIAANKAGQLIPHAVNAPPAQNPPKQGGPKKRDLLQQGFGYGAEDFMRSPAEKDMIRGSDSASQKPGANKNQNSAAAPKQNFDPSKTDYANYGKNQFIFQPLLVNPTEIPDPDVEDTEYYSGQKYTDPQLVNKDLVELGLDGEINSYIMPFTLNSVIQAQEQADAKHVDPKIPITLPPATIPKKTRRQGQKSTYKISDEYKKLVDTYRNIRGKRQNEERIGKLYGAKPINYKVEDFKAENKELHDISKVSFEKPLVFSLEG